MAEVPLFGKSKGNRLVHEFDDSLEKLLQVIERKLKDKRELTLFKEVIFCLDTLTFNILQKIKANASWHKQLMAEMAKKFVIDRKDMVMGRIPYFFKLEEVIDELSLDFRQAKRLFRVRFERFDLEQVMLEETINITLKDQLNFRIEQDYMLIAGRGINWQVNSCARCEKSLFTSANSRSAVLFTCAHYYHKECLMETCPEEILQEENFVLKCP